ncbi:hypothetical protein LTR09_006174 [Extremus antarcticus]|uniref:DUF7702 domain-containing protein n=1 Tax=Extremus antarcticus TaxID=702011 RepID=A0AAJ0GBT4_9PEZI|nr:hypothetical protein LTR09_006174 [Extremus antarcticus]
MAPLQPEGGLAAAEVAFYGPALLISTYIVFRHGLRGQLGWLYLVTLSILRLVGGSATLWSETQNDYSPAVLETAFITSAVGTAPLLLVLLGFLERVNDRITVGGVGKWVFRGIHLLSITALVLAIIGGTDIADRSASSRSTGHTLLQAGSVIFLAIYLALAAITILTFRRKGDAQPGDWKLIDAGLAALPFLLVRILYTVIVAFAKEGSVFYFSDVDVYVSAFMQFLMEAFVVVIFIVAGLLTPKQDKEGRGQREIGSVDLERAGGRGPMRSEDAGAGSKVEWGERRQRSAWDYRPSKLISDAISGR